MPEDAGSPRAARRPTTDQHDRVVGLFTLSGVSAECPTYRPRVQGSVRPPPPCCSAVGGTRRQPSGGLLPPEFPAGDGSIPRTVCRKVGSSPIPGRFNNAEILRSVNNMAICQKALPKRSVPGSALIEHLPSRSSHGRLVFITRRVISCSGRPCLTRVPARRSESADHTYFRSQAARTVSVGRQAIERVISPGPFQETPSVCEVVSILERFWWKRLAIVGLRLSGERGGCEGAGVHGGESHGPGHLQP